MTEGIKSFYRTVAVFGDALLEDPAEVTADEISGVMVFGLLHHICSYQNGFSNFHIFIEYGKISQYRIKHLSFFFTTNHL